jgi:hypothetical protein
LGVKGECPRQLSRRREAKDPCREGEPAQVLARQIHIARLAGKIVEGSGGVGLRLGRHLVVGPDHPVDHTSRRETRHRRPGAHPEVTADDGRPGVGDCFGGEDGEAVCRAEPRRGCSVRSPPDSYDQKGDQGQCDPEDAHRTSISRSDTPAPHPRWARFEVRSHGVSCSVAWTIPSRKDTLRGLKHG